MRMSVGFIIPIVCGIAMTRLFDLNSIFTLLAAIVAYTAIYALSMWFLGMNKYEKNLVKAPMRKIMKRGKA